MKINANKKRKYSYTTAIIFRNSWCKFLDCVKHNFIGVYIIIIIASYTESRLIIFF